MRKDELRKEMFRYYILLFVSLFLCEKVVSTSVCSDISSTAVKNEAALISSTLLASATFISEYLDEGLPDYFSSSIGTNLTHREQARAHLMSLILDKDSYFGDNMQLMSVNFIAKNSVWMGYTRFYSPASSPNEIRYIGDANPSVVSSTSSPNAQYAPELWACDQTSGELTNRMASLPRETPQSRGWYNVGGAAEFSTTPAVTWAPPQVKTGPSSSDEPMVVMSGAFPWNVDDTLVGVFGFEVVLDNMWAGTMGGRLNCSSCHDGYASEADGCPASCSSECTGGALCTSTNTCTCPFGFADSRFNSCAGNSSICTLNGAGNVQSLTESSSGAYLNLSTGVYNMFESDSMEIGVHVWKCANDRSCVDAVSFRALPSGDKIEISANTMKAYYGCEYSSDMPLPSTVDDVSVSLLSPNHWVITHGDISANVLQGASDLSLDVVLEFHDSDTSSVSGQCSGKVSGSSLVSDDIQKMAESWSSSGLFCSNFTQASHAEAKRISPFNYACLDSSVDRERCCFSLKGCGDLYTQCVYDHCVLASGSCLDLTDRVRALKECPIVDSGCSNDYSSADGMTSFIIENKAGSPLLFWDSHDLPLSWNSEYVLHETPAFLDSTSSANYAVKSSSYHASDILDIAASTWIAGGVSYVASVIAVTVKGLDLAVFAVKTDTSTPKTSALEQSAKSFILASAASESSNVAREHYDRNPSLLSKMHISRDGDRAGKPTRESHVQAIGSAADTTPTQCELISISEDDDLAEVGLGMKILMLSVGIAGLTTFVGIGTLFFEGTQILPFESSDFVVKDTSILAGEGRGLTMDGPNEERKQHYATPNTSGPFTEHEL